MVNTEIDKLAKEYFIDELGLASTDVAEARKKMKRRIKEVPQGIRPIE